MTITPIDKQCLKCGEIELHTPSAVECKCGGKLINHEESNMVMSHFKFKFTYFKKSGKYYSDAEEMLLCGVCSDEKTAYMPSIVAAAKERIASGKPLPGLQGSWDGPILIDCEEGFPCLILPEGHTNPIDSTANSIQHGGSHYKDKAIEPWDYIVSNNLGFLEGNAVKYLSRWREKNGIEDLKKAIHYIQKLIEIEEKNNATT